MHDDTTRTVELHMEAYQTWEWQEIAWEDIAHMLLLYTDQDAHCSPSRPGNWGLEPDGYTFERETTTTDGR